MIGSMWSSKKAAIVVAIVLIVLLFPWIYMISCTAFTYTYWLFPKITYASTKHVSDKESLPVPAIIHQTWKSKDIPEKWQKAQKSCIDLHPDYEYKLWTDEDGLALIEEHFPWFLPTYLAYPYDIQRVDAVRYFILLKFGGVYIDLDMGCSKRFDFLRRANFTAPLTYPVGISNDVMAAAPESAYLTQAVTQLPRWNHWLFIKYIQVMFGTGPMFLTVQYALMPRKIKLDVSAIPKDAYGKYDFSGDPVFYHLHGSSWHADDAAVVFWLDKYKGLLVGLGVVVAISGMAVWYMQKKKQAWPHQRVASRETFDVEKQF